MEDQKCRLSPTTLTIFILGLIYILSISPANTAIAVADTSSSLSTYIIHVRKPTDKHSSTSEDLDTWYRSFLPTTATSSNQEQRIVHSYRHVLSGFAAKLTAEEAKAIREKDGVLYVHPEKVLSLHTTHTPDFLGLHQGVGVWKDSNFGKGVIIGVLDSGVSPHHPSFGDKGVPPPPTKWKGRCDFNGTSCNNKLIGARSFLSSSDTVGQAVPPYDVEGHGTHTSSTAAGAFVRGASALGNAKGTAIGMAPLAHLAVYRVCNVDGCPDGDILAGFDAAIEDGVDVLSLSLGGYSIPFYNDVIALGAFAATQKGIFVSCAAGNSGPTSSTLSNEAPWILTVGASSIDRSIKATARLGNGQEFDGETLYQPHDFHPVLLPLVYPGVNGDQHSAECLPGSLENRTDLQGKVVVCDMGDGSGLLEKGQEVKDAGGAAMILVNGPIEGYTTLAEKHVLPSVHVRYVAAREIKRYLKTASAPMATILFKGTRIGRSVAPAVAFFSSRGPNEQSRILKPDIIGPGVNTLAGWPFPLDNSTDMKHAFNVISGTSMSCPHLSGVAALLKSAHPDWSPAAIKSAMMTTAATSNMLGRPIVDETLHPADIFATGAGHINPSKAVDPGLIYDIGPRDYIPYLCGLNYNDSQIELIVKEKVTCSSIRSIPDYLLNYPSISLWFNLLDSVTKLSVMRTVRNVGPAKSSYRAVIDPIIGLDSIVVHPNNLKFSEANQTASFRVDFRRKVDPNETMVRRSAQGAITWVSAQHSVRTPVAVVVSTMYG